MLFLPPIFPGEAEKTRAAALLHSMLLACTVSMPFLFLGSLIGGTVRSPALVVMALAFLSGLFLQILLRRGALRLTSWLLVLVLTSSAAVFIYLHGTIRSPSAVIYLILASLMAGLLINRRAAFLSALFNCALFLGLLAAELKGLLPPPFFAVSITQGLAFVVGSLLTIMLVNQAIRSIDESLALAQRELAEHRQADERAQSRSVILEKVVQLGKTVTEVTDLRTTLLRIWAGVRSELDFDRVAIFLYNPHENVMQGTFGTERNGNLSEIWDLKFGLKAGDPFDELLSRPNGFRFTHDFQAELEHDPNDRMVGVKEHVSVAVWAGEKPVAVITVDQLLTQRLITAEQVEALRLFAGYAGLALQNARLNERERSRQAMLEKVIRLGKLVTEEADYRTVLLRIYTSVREGLGFDRLGLFIYDPGCEVMRGSFGTDRSGQMREEWDLVVPLSGSAFYANLITRPDGYYFTQDYEKELNPGADDMMSGVKYYAAVSAWKNDRPVAILSVDQLNSGREITEEQLEALRLFAGYAGLAIENARLGELERSRQAMLEKVIRLGKMVTKVGDYQTVLLRIWKGVRSELGFDRLGLFIYEPGKQLMVGSFGTDRAGNLVEEWDLQFALDGEDFFSKVFNRPDGFFFTQDYEHEFDDVSGSQMAGVKHYAAVSAWAGDKPAAILCVDQLVTGRPITEEQLEALRLFAGYAGLAIENARLGGRERSRQEMLKKVIDLGKQVTGAGDYRTVLFRIFNGVRSELGFDRLGLFIYDASSRRMRGSYGSDRNGQMVEEWQLEFSIEGESVFSSVVSRPDGYFFTPDYETERQLPQQHVMRGVKAYAAVSAWAGDKPVAILCVDQLVSGREITEEQLEALRLFAGYAGLAIENARLGERERSQREKLERVINLGQVVTEIADYRTVLLRIFTGVRDELDFDRVGLFVYDPSRNSMRGTFGTDRHGNLREEWDLDYPLSSEVFSKVLFSRRDGFDFTPDYEKDHYLPSDAGMNGVKSHASVAAWAGDKPVAIIAVDQLLSGRQITAEQLEALRLFAGYAGLAIENARLKSELEQRVQQRTAQLEAANQELESFSYSVSHDLRAPLRAINGFSKILTEDFSAELTPTAQGFLRKISVAGGQMGHLIDDLLDLSRLGRKPLAFQRLDLNRVVQAVLETLALEMANRQIEWVRAELPPARVDPVLIQQVYLNLVGNALKYSRKRELARIEIGSLTQNGEIVYFVRDNGAGFEMQYAERLFGVFQRLHREEDFEGTGIGLAIVQRIIQRHGGRVWAEGVVNQGATFYFTVAEP